MQEILTNPWITLPLLLGLFVVLFWLAFPRRTAPVERSVPELLEFLQTHPFSEWTGISADSRTPPVVLAWMADELLAHKPKVLRHRTNTVAASEWGWNINNIARHPKAWEDTLMRLAQESEAHWCEWGVCRNPRATPKILLVLVGSEWEDIRKDAYDRLCRNHPVFVTHNSESILARSTQGLIAEKKRKAYQDRIRPVWQPRLYPEMHSEKAHYPKETT